MTMGAAPPERFDIGRVISAGFGLLSRRAVPVLSLAILCLYLPVLVESWALAYGGLMPAPGATRDPAAAARLFFIGQAISIVVAGFRAILAGGVAIIATADASGGLVDRAVWLRMARAAPLLFAVGIAATFGIVVGTILLIVPGILLALAWFLCSAAVAVEHKSFLGAFRRSAELTKGSRSGLFAITLIFGGASLVLGLTLRLTAGGPLLEPPTQQPPLFTFVLQPALGLILSAVIACVNAAAYLELHGVKEGVAAVFD